MAVVGTMLLAFGNGGVSYAERTLPSGLAALLVASVPLWMALADQLINGRRLRPRGWAALVIGLAGIAIVAQPHGHGAVLPVLVVLGASMSWGIGSVLAGRLPAPVSPLLGSAMEMLAGGAVLVGLAVATGEDQASGHASGESLLALAYLIGPGSLLALTCYVIALRRLPTSVVSTYAYVNPVVAVVLGALLLGERLTVTTLIGGAVVVASVALLLSRATAGAHSGKTARAAAPSGGNDCQLPRVSRSCGGSCGGSRPGRARRGSCRRRGRRCPGPRCAPGACARVPRGTCASSHRGPAWRRARLGRFRGGVGRGLGGLARLWRGFRLGRGGLRLGWRCPG